MKRVCFKAKPSRLISKEQERSLEDDPATRIPTSVKFDSFMEGKSANSWIFTAEIQLWRPSRIRCCAFPSKRATTWCGISTKRASLIIVTNPRNEIIADYNEVRHAGTAYSLLDLYGATKDIRYRVAGERAIEIMLHWVRTVESDDREAIVYERGQAKLGGTALAIVAILKHVETTGEAKWMDHAKKMGRFLILQQHKDGRFGSKYFFRKKKTIRLSPFTIRVKQCWLLPGCMRRIRIITEWLPAAKRGADWLINVRDAKQENLRIASRSLALDCTE